VRQPTGRGRADAGPRDRIWGEGERPEQTSLRTRPKFPL
jgi:hypothetical protein